jgi:subtilisin
MTRGVQVAGEVQGSRTLALSVAQSDLDAVLDSISHLPWVESVSVGTDDNVVQADILPWGISNTAANQVSSLFNNRGAGIKVGFLDTGVDCNHADLTARIVGGYDFVNGNGTYCVYSSAHGTAVAGIIAASSNGTGVVGMAPEANLYSLRVCDATSCTDARIVLALQWALTNGIKVANLSFGNCGANAAPIVATAVANAIAGGVVVVAAAGNGTANGCPANSPVSGIARLPSVIAVSAMLSNLTTPTGYQYGPDVDLAAPTGVQADSLAGLLWTVFGGTSAATPHVTGAVALMLKNGIVASQIFTKLTAGAVDRGTAGKDNYFGYGSLDALTAVQPPPLITAIAPCMGPPLYAGDCQLTAVITNGISPFLVKWNVTYSNGSHAPINTGFVSTNYVIPVPEGSYDITVTVTPKENGVRTRTGAPTIFTFPVCPAGDGGGGGDPVPFSLCP